MLNRGGAEFFYRLRIGDFPLATTPIPMAAKRGSKAKVGFAGPAVEGVAPVDVAVPTDPSVERRLGRAQGRDRACTVGRCRSSSAIYDEAVEPEPNNEPKQANRITVPAASRAGFRRATTRTITSSPPRRDKSSPSRRTRSSTTRRRSSTMVLKNAKTGAEVAKTNPRGPIPRDQRIDFTAADDGDYMLEVHTSVTSSGGPTESLSLHRPSRDDLPSS